MTARDYLVEDNGEEYSLIEDGDFEAYIDDEQEVRDQVEQNRVDSADGHYQVGSSDTLAVNSAAGRVLFLEQPSGNKHLLNSSLSEAQRRLPCRPTPQGRCIPT